jgi:hypothetical protein
VTGKTVVPQEAVEAAAIGIAHENMSSRKWADLSEGIRDTFLADARAALEAAAPFIAAKALEGAADSALDREYGLDGMSNRDELQDVIERMVRSVFLDSPEDADSVTVATNVTRALWEEGYRKQGDDGSSRDIIAGIIGQMAYGPGEGADLTRPQATADAILAYLRARAEAVRGEG